MSLILNFISAGIVYLSAFILFNTLYSNNKVNKKLRLLIFGFATFGSFGVNFLGIPVLNISYIFITISVLNVALYEYKSLMFLLYNALLSFIVIITDMGSNLILSSIYGQSINETLSAPNFNIARYLLNWLMFFILFKIFLALVKRGTITKLKLHELVLYLLLASIEVYSLNYVSIILKDSTGKELIVMLLVFLFLNWYIAYLINRISKSNQLEHELSLARQQSNMQLAAYREVSDKYQLSRSITHDIKEHIKSLEGLIDSNHIESAQEYTKLLNQKLGKLEPEFKNNSEILSVIISNKLIQAKKQDILLELDVEEDIPIDFISDLDITTIFANILDNAIEACSELAVIERKIRLITKQKVGLLLINVSNEYKEIDFEKNNFMTTKKGHEGIGLSNVRSVVEKYNGVFDIETMQNKFIAKITIPISKE